MGRGEALEDVQRLSREGDTGKRPVGEIGFATTRGGDNPASIRSIWSARGNGWN